MRESLWEMGCVGGWVGVGWWWWWWGSGGEGVECGAERVRGSLSKLSPQTRA